MQLKDVWLIFYWGTPQHFWLFVPALGCGSEPLTIDKYGSSRLLSAWAGPATIAYGSYREAAIATIEALKDNITKESDEDIRREYAARAESAISTRRNLLSQLMSEVGIK